MMSKLGYLIYLAIVLTALGFAVGLIIATYQEDHQTQQPQQAAVVEASVGEQ